ncbi:hypothetical protein MMC11_002906 [Xylographa trunciseda]|nr:hypothetical protein [Xylographa trunciseda]
MSNENSPPTTPTARRASFAPGQRLSQLFGRSPGDTASTATPPYPGPIAAAAANAQASQRRRMSISTLGLSGSPTQTSPFGSFRGRQESISSNGSGSPAVEESAIEEGDAGPIQTPSTPFGRRMSFGARALRDVRAGSGNVNGRPSITSASSPPNKGRGLSSSPVDEEEAPKKASNTYTRRTGEGFNWSDQLRSRAQRSSSITSPTTPFTAPTQDHTRTASVAAMVPPAKEVPKVSKAPDHFQERILKGDFYMD